MYCQNPNAPFVNLKQKRIREDAKRNYQLIEGRLHRVATKYHPEPRRVVVDDEAFDIITNVHSVILNHGGIRKVCAYINPRYSGM